MDINQLFKGQISFASDFAIDSQTVWQNQYIRLRKLTNRLNLVSRDQAYLLLCWPRVFLQSVHRYILDEVTWKDYTPLYFSFYIANKLSAAIIRSKCGRNVTSKNKITSCFKTFRVSLLSISGVLAPPYQPRWFGVTESIQYFVRSVFFEKVQMGAMF